MTDQQYQKQLEQYTACVEQSRREALAWLKHEGRVEPDAVWGEKVENVVVSIVWA